MLYILAGAQIGQSPKNWKACRIICIQHFWCTFISDWCICWYDI